MTGTTVVRLTVDEGDNSAAIPPPALSVAATSMTKGFGATTWGEYDLTQDNPTCGALGETNMVTVSATAGAVKGTGAVCFTITDSDGADTEPDTNAGNTRAYILILTISRRSGDSPQTS